MKASARFVSRFSSFGFGRGNVGRAATPSISSGAKGIGASSSQAPLASLALVLACALVVGLALSGQASASPIYKFKEAFGSAVHPTFTEPTGLAVDQSTGDLLVMDRGDGTNGTISRFKADGTPADFSALGTNVIDGAGGADKTLQAGLTFPLATEAQIAIDNSGTVTDGDIYVTASPNVIDIFASSGAYLGQLTASGGGPFNEACGVAVDSGGAVYVGDYLQGIHKFSPAANPPENTDFVTTFDDLDLPCTLAAGAGPTAGSIFPANFTGRLFRQNATSGHVDYPLSTDSTTTEAVVPGNGHVLAAEGKEVVEYTAASASQSARLSSFAVGSAVEGIAADSSDDAYVSRKGASGLEVWTLITLPTVAAGAATGVTPSAASLHGTVNAEGLAVASCKFEYGLTTSAGFEKEAPCSPPAADIPADLSTHSVSAALTGLQANATYKFRLTAGNVNGTANSEAVTFTTSGPPLISEIRALNATQSSATLEGKVNPSGFGTSYRFEWGPSASYGHQVPAEFEPFVGSGNQPVRVSAKLSGLAAGTTYHYRIVASSVAGTSASPDQIAETLNSCGLPEGRCFELVSRREAGPGGIPGESAAAREMHYQAATGGPGALAYVVEAGYPEATTGAEVLYRGSRGPAGWASTQLSTPIVAANEQSGGGSGSGRTQWLSNDLSCGFAASTQPLTADPSTRLVIEEGGSNLYRVNPDGSYTAVSNLAPENPGLSSYSVAGASQDCGKVLFSSSLRYPGIPGQTGPGELRLYEWDEGTLRNAGVVPGPSGEVVVAADSSGQNTVSEDGSRVFFSATRQTSPNPAEIGAKAIFVRENGTVTRDLSLSQTATPDTGANYSRASADGSRVFFTANAGLTAESSPEGTDLYEYDLETEALSDRSVSQAAGGAQVVSFLGASEDGSQVYFTSRNQLVPGRGSSRAENLSAETLSIYGESGGEISFAGTMQGGGFSQVSPDGRYLLFESTADFTGYDSGGSFEAYLYDANGGSEGTTCVSCRQDGQPSVGHVSEPTGSSLDEYTYNPLPVGFAISNELHLPQYLTVDEGEPRVFFSSADSLAPGAVEGQNNIYEWSHGQVFRFAGALKDTQEIARSGFYNLFAGASADSSDAYLITAETLNWEDGDKRLSAYDARIGGGFPEPPAPPAPCEATSEGSCQGAAQAGPAVAGAGSATFSGPGNPAAQNKQKKAKKKHHKKGKKKRVHSKQARNANGNRRAGK